AGPRRGHVSGRTSHVDIQPVESQLADDMSGLIKEDRILPVQLRHHWPLVLTVQERAQEMFRASADVPHAREFREGHIRRTLHGHDLPKGAIGATVHRGKPDNGSGKRVPKACVRTVTRYS